MNGRAGATAFLLLAAFSAAPTLWPAAPRDFAARSDVDVAAARFPNSSNLLRRRLGAALDAGARDAALDASRRLAAMGGTLSPASRLKVAALVGAGEMDRLAPAFDANAAPRSASRRFATIPVEHRLIEGLAWDPAAHRLFAASVLDRRLVARDELGRFSIVGEGGFGSLLGAVWDSKRRRVWAASAMIDETPKDRPGFSGIVGIDPDRRGAPIRLAAPAGAAPGDVALADDGTLYASDGLNGAVYRCRLGCRELETWLSPGLLFSAQGMAVSHDGKWLYVADYRYGLAAVDRALGRIVKVAASPDMMLDGIDGLVRRGSDLIAVQNGIAVPRIVRLRLARDGLSIVGIDLLERANPAWGGPTLATVAGDLLLYVADPQWESYGAGGVTLAGKIIHPISIRAIRLGRPHH